MGERLVFGMDAPPAFHRSRTTSSVSMFPGCDELPLFSGTPIPATERVYLPQDHSWKQAILPGLPSIDYEHILEQDRKLRGKRPSNSLPEAATLFTLANDTMQDAPTTITAADSVDATSPLREAISSYLDLVSLRRLAAMGAD